MAFTHMLVPTDFSEPASHALRYAIEEATRCQVKVTLLHVLPPRRETDVYYVAGSPGPPLQGSLDPAAGWRLGTQSLSQPTVLLSDPNEEAEGATRELQTWIAS